eukprot:scaffold170906_cov46-Tisochrysis_lutea.AAC.1
MQLAYFRPIRGCFSLPLLCSNPTARRWTTFAHLRLAIARETDAATGRIPPRHSELLLALVLLNRPLLFSRCPGAVASRQPPAASSDRVVAAASAVRPVR